MFGYVRPAGDALSEQEKLRFHAIYCGLCHMMGKKYGFLSRFFLNYDFTFLAIMLSDVGNSPCDKKRCLRHPCKGCSFVNQNPALERAADCSIVLLWWQLQDHIADKSRLKALPYRAVRCALKRPYRKAKQSAAAFDRCVQDRMAELGQLEQQKCASIDEAAEPFANLMSGLASELSDEKQRRIFSQIFYHLGRWIYLVDALDDFANDAKSGNYNPLRYRYCAFENKLDDSAKRMVGETLDVSIDCMASAYALWDFGTWTPILDSIFYRGLYAVGNAVLCGSFHAGKQRIPLKNVGTRKENERSV